MLADRGELDLYEPIATSWPCRIDGRWGAATAAYERSNVGQPVFVVDDLRALLDRLETELDPDQLGRHLRTGGRRTRQEAIDIGRASLKEYIDEQGDTPRTTGGATRSSSGAI